MPTHDLYLELHFSRQLDDSDDETEYDEEGNPIVTKKSKVIDPLPSIDHSTFNYAEYNKNFYQEHEDIAALDHLQVDELRKKLGITVGYFIYLMLIVL